MYIFGLSSFAQVMGALVPNQGFTVHRQYITPDSGAIAFEDLPPCDLLIAIGPGKLCKNRENVYGEAVSRGFTVFGYVDEAAILRYPCSVSDSAIILEQNNIQPFASVGRNTVLWSGNHVGHHSRIGAHCFITSHVCIAGRVEIGDNTFIGINASICNDVKVGRECFIAAGAVVDRDMPDGAVWGRKGLTKIASGELEA